MLPSIVHYKDALNPILSKHASTFLFNTPAVVNFWPFNSFPKWQILDSSELKELADANLTLYEKGRKFSKRRENSLGKKGEIAHYEQFLLFPQCFQKTCTEGMYKPGLLWERVNIHSNV